MSPSPTVVLVHASTRSSLPPCSGQRRWEVGLPHHLTSGVLTSAARKPAARLAFDGSQGS